MSEFEFDGQEENKFNDDLDDNTEAKVEYTLPYTVTLSRPIKLGKKEITELVFVNDIEMSMLEGWVVDQDKNPLKMGHILHLITKMTGNVPQVAKKLSLTDFNTCSVVAVHFLTSGQQTGE